MPESVQVITTRIRMSARVLVLDEGGRLLMFQIHDLAAERGLNPIRPDFWLLPGGGVQAGESYEQAARREVLEETGIGGLTLSPCVHTRDKVITWIDGEPMQVVERFYVASVASGTPVSFAGHEPLEASTIMGYHWFTHAEIVAREASETFVPPGLGALLDQILSARSEPMEAETAMVADQRIQLNGTRVLLTGGTSGLGLAMAAALSEAGAEVALTSRSAERAEEVAARLPGAIGLAADSRDPVSVARVADEAWSRLGGIDMLVNNAGLGMITVNPRFMSEPMGFWNVPVDGFKDVMDTNLTGYFLMAREITPRMLQAGGGRIVNISMNHATMNRRGFVPYGPSRAGAEALSRIMAADLRETPVRVNMLLPGGATETGMLPPAQQRPAALKLIDPAVMGPPIVWLASPQARDVHDERIVATNFDEWLRAAGSRPGTTGIR